MPRSNTKRRLAALIDSGFDAAMLGLPCEAPTTREIDRAAWEQGWRAGAAVRRIDDTPYDHTITLQGDRT